MPTRTHKQKDARKRRNARSLTDANQILQECAAAWNAAPLEARAAWDEAAALLHDGLQPAQAARATGYKAFCKHNAVNRGVQNPLMLWPPDFGPVQPLPRVTLAASWTPETGLSLLLTPDAPISCKLELWGTRPLTAPRPVYDSTPFKRCGTLNGIMETTDAAPLFLTRYRVPCAGYKIALKLCGVTPHGQRTPTLLLVEIAAAPPAHQLKMG